MVFEALSGAVINDHSEYTELAVGFCLYILDARIGSGKTNSNFVIYAYMKIHAKNTISVTTSAVAAV